jgi:hypothetical protein
VIELDYPRERMLADIRASDGALRLQGLTAEPDRAAFVAADEARLLARVRTPQEILPELDAVLAARFAAVPADRLHRNLLSPLKKAVGNAHKRGNRGAPDKWIQVEVVVTRSGAFVEVSDEGSGFDVPGTLARFQAGAQYFAHKGSGFRRYAKARSVVSFDRGGSTIRVCFAVGNG